MANGYFNSSLTGQQIENILTALKRGLGVLRGDGAGNITTIETTTAVSDKSTDSELPTAKAVNNALSGKVNSADIYTKEQIDQKIAAATPSDYAEVKTQVETNTTGISQLKADLTEIEDELYSNYRDIPVNVTADGWKLQADGRCSEDSGSKIVKYKVIEGKKIHLKLSKDNDCVYQWQNNASVPSTYYSTNQYLVGKPITQPVDDFVTVPNGATYLIVSQFKTNDTNSVSKIDSISNRLYLVEKYSHILQLESGNFKDSGNYDEKQENQSRFRTKEPISIYDIGDIFIDAPYGIWGYRYDKDMKYLGEINYSNWVRTVEIEKLSGKTRYINIVIRNNTHTTSDIKDEYEEVTRSISFGDQRRNIDATNLTKTTKASVHMGNYGEVSIERALHGNINIRFYSSIEMICPAVYAQKSISLDNIVEMLPSRATKTDNHVDMYVGAQGALVYNIDAEMLYLRNIEDVISSDLVLVGNGYSTPYGYLVEYATRKKADKVNSMANNTTDPYIDKMQKYANLMLNASNDFENFLFFSDPHSMYGDYNIDPELRTHGCIYFDKYIDDIKFAFESTPTDFVLCGGDWNDGGKPSEELFKLSRAKEICNNRFTTFYTVVGNHDTNYQGAERFTPKCMKNLWYRDYDHCYYTFNGRNTKFYALDTQTENQSMKSNGEYLHNELLWFIDALKKDNTLHKAITMHIYYSTGSSMNVFSEWVMKVCCAFNARTTFNYDNIGYDFSDAIGKIEFVIVGHSHRDFDTTYSSDGVSIPVIATINAGNSDGDPNTYAGAKHALFDLVNADYDNRKINLVRIGDLGTDRIIQI